jgi:hypothetical protein
MPTLAAYAILAGLTAKNRAILASMGRSVRGGTGRPFSMAMYPLKAFPKSEAMGRAVPQRFLLRRGEVGA